MTNINKSRFRSPYRDIDVPLLKALCELHPWPLRDLCQQVGMKPSVLSNVFSGQRPLPTSVAKDFLNLMGMKDDGSLDSDHGFVLMEKNGRRTELTELMARIFPNHAGVVFLKSTSNNPSEISDVQGSTNGQAFFDTRYAAVVHNCKGFPWASILENDSYALRDHITAGTLLSTKTLPSKLDILKAFAGSKFVIQVTWEDVRIACERSDLTASDCLILITDAVRERTDNTG